MQCYARTISYEKPKYVKVYMFSYMSIVLLLNFSRKWREEEEVYQMLERYYNKPDEMLVPAMKPGTELPYEIINFYKKVKEHVKK